MSKRLLRGLYCITDPKLVEQSPLDIEEMVQQAIDGGASTIQYRDKTSTLTQQTEIAHRLCQLCQRQSVIFLVNDDPHLAKTVDADGVHLGQTDSGLTAARELLGNDKIIGVSCHDSLELARTALQQGADYVAFGRFYPSQTKPEANPASINLLPLTKSSLQIPIVAIGGITAENAPDLLEAGADMLAVIHNIFGQEDIRQAASNIARLFN